MLTITDLCLLSLASLLIIFLIGKTFFFVFYSEIYKKANFYSKFFFEMISGITIIAVITSLIHNSLQSINILFLLLIIEFFILKRLRKEKILNMEFNLFKQINKAEIFKILILFAFHVLIFLIHAIYFYSFSEKDFKIPDVDLLFYSRVSESIYTYARENISFSYNAVMPPDDNGIILYHFFDLWVNVFFGKLYNLSAYISLIFIVYPVFTFILFTGIVSLWQKIGNINILKLAISVMLLFVSGLYFDFYALFKYMTNTIPLLTDTMPFTYYGRKLIPVAIFAALVLNLFIDKYYHKGTVFLLFTIVVYTSGTMFGLISGVSAVFIVYILFNKLLKRVIIIEKETIIFGIAFIVLFIGFTLTNSLKNFSDRIVINSIFNFASTEEMMQNIRSAAAVIFYYVLFFIFCYSLLILPILINFRKIKQHIAVLKIYFFYITLALIIGIFALFIFYKDLDSRQFFTNLLPFVNILIIFCFIVFYEKMLIINKITVPKIITITIIAFIFYSNISWLHLNQRGYPKFKSLYSDTFLENTKRQLAKFPHSQKIAYRIKNGHYIFYLPLFTNWSFLDMYGYTNFVNNSKIDFKLFSNKNYSNNSELCDFVDKTKDSVNYQLNYLLENDIKILVSDTLQTDIPEYIISDFYVNEKNQECIYFLDY